MSNRETNGPGGDHGRLRDFARNIVSGVTTRSLLTLAALLVTAAVLLTLFPDRREAVTERSLEFFIEMASILPAVVVLLGLFSVFVPKQLIADHLGSASGVKGFLLSLGLGALPTGPLYVAFPIAAAMMRKGASVRNMIVFLTAWASVKLPQEMVELRFMGLEFTLLRLVLTVSTAAILGWVVERLLPRGASPPTAGGGAE